MSRSTCSLYKCLLFVDCHFCCASGNQILTRQQEAPVVPPEEETTNGGGEEDMDIEDDNSNDEMIEPGSKWSSVNSNAVTNNTPKPPVDDKDKPLMFTSAEGLF